MEEQGEEGEKKEEEKMVDKVDEEEVNEDCSSTLLHTGQTRVDLSCP